MKFNNDKSKWVYILYVTNPYPFACEDFAKNAFDVIEAIFWLLSGQ